MKKVAIIGATGSVGTQTAEVILLNRREFEPVLVTCRKNCDALKELGAKLCTDNLLCTEDSGELTARLEETDFDIAVVAAAGTGILKSIYHLAERGVTIAMANKECIVSAGRFIMEALKASGGKIIPVDSEHSAIFQCIEANNINAAKKIVLTASGGAFRDTPADKLKNVTVADALKHPNWKMGKKITIDSATMMNKGLELIEARFLFDMNAEKLDVVIHPESIVHSFVEFIDGSVLAQLAYADMRVPISYALGYPERILSGVNILDFACAMNLSFSPLKHGMFPCFDTALAVLKSDRHADMIVLNAANEFAVNSFIEGDIGFTDIARFVEEALAKYKFSEPKNIDEAAEISCEVTEQLRSRP